MRGWLAKLNDNPRSVIIVIVVSVLAGFPVELSRKPVGWIPAV